jgi:hypothetical protein
MKNGKVAWSRLMQGIGLAFIIAGGLVTVGLLKAQEPTQEPAPISGPAARAARLSDVEGQVQLAQGNQIIASQAPVNAPLFEGAQITTSDDGHAEIQFDDGSIARVSPNSSISLSVLRQQAGVSDTEILVNGGLNYFEIQNSTQPDSFRVRFGSSIATATGFTILRLDFDSPPGTVAVFSGNAHISGANSLAADVNGGESLKLGGDMPGNYTVTDVIEPDSWDSWNSDRDQALTAQEAQQTAATTNVPDNSNPAWSDLDANGNWYNVPGQGYVWSPYEAENANWDPYGCGSWMWTPGYGYVWASCESWGYMPYAYGGWSYYNGIGWGWAPGFGGPWWGGGIYIINIHNAPNRYRPPNRPHGGPVPPGGSGMQVHVAGGRYQPYPIVPVNRNNGDVHGAPVRVRGGPVTVAGNTVMPVQPIAPNVRAAAPRAGYLPQSGYSSGFVQHNGNMNVSRPIYGIDTGSQGIIARPPTYTGGTYSRPTPPAGRYSPPGSNGPSSGYSAPRPSAPSHAPMPAPNRPAPMGAPRPSSGGAPAAHAVASPHK